MARPKAVRTNQKTIEATIIDAIDIRYESLVTFNERLKKPSVLEAVDQDDRLFSTIIAYATEEFGIRKNVLAEELNVSPAAIGRWAVESALPPRYGRAAIVQAISRILDRTIAEQKRKKLRVGSASWSGTE